MSTKSKEIKIIITHRSVMGSLANWAVQQSPYHRPDNLEVVLDKLNEQIKDEFDENEKYIKKFETWKEAKDWADLIWYEQIFREGLWTMTIKESALTK